MTAIRVVLLQCDQCGFEYENEPTFTSAKAARAEAERDGWHVAIRGPKPAKGDLPGDLCATCAAPRKLIDILTPEDCHEGYDWIDPYGDTP